MTNAEKNKQALSTLSVFVRLKKKDTTTKTRKKRTEEKEASK